MSLFLYFVACGAPGRTLVVVSVDPGTEPDPDPDTQTTPTTETPTVDSGTWTPTTDSGTPPDTEPEPVGPSIDAIGLTELDETVEVVVALVAGDAPLDGGVLGVRFDGVDTDVALPDPLVGDTVSLSFDRPGVGACSEGALHALELVVTDRAGRTSEPVDADLQTSDQGIIVTEVGSTADTNLSLIPAGTRICGELSGAGNDGFTYTSDIDLVTFEVDPTDLWSVVLDWEATGDYDLSVFERSFGELYLVDEAIDPADHGPVDVTTTLSRNQRYTFRVAAWSGNAGDWTVELR